MPRLSVDIDLTYLRIASREETLTQISQKLNTISAWISSALPSAQIEEKTEIQDSLITKLFVKKQNAIVKIEPNQVIRGALFACKERYLCKKAEEVFEKKGISVRNFSFWINLCLRKVPI